MANEIRTIVQSMSDFGDTEVDAAIVTALFEIELDLSIVITEAASNTDDYLVAKVALNILINKRNIRLAKIAQQVYVPLPIITEELRTKLIQKDETALLYGLSTPPDTSTNHWSTKVT